MFDDLLCLTGAASFFASFYLDPNNFGMLGILILGMLKPELFFFAADFFIIIAPLILGADDIAAP